MSQGLQSTRLKADVVSKYNAFAIERNAILRGSHILLIQTVDLAIPSIFSIYKIRNLMKIAFERHTGKVPSRG